MTKVSSLVALALGISALTLPAYSADPTPESQMRELNTDRPDKTESPISVDAGHFQLETDLAILTRDTKDGTTTQTLSFNVANVKMGLTSCSDIQLIVPTYTLMTTSDGSSVQGFGDLTARFKLNWFGNDAGPVAMGMILFLNIPTGRPGLSKEGFDGGLILPLLAKLPGDFGLGFMMQYNHAKNSTNRGYHSELVSSLTVGHSIIGELGGYAEVFSKTSAEDGAPWVVTADFGLTYGLTPNIQFDGGINVGVTPGADDLNPFVGVTLRI